MINQHSIDAVDNSKFGNAFVKPLYGSYCFSRIPATILSLLTGVSGETLPKDVFGTLNRRPKKVVLFFVDAFGWCFFEKYKNKYPFLKRFESQGIVSKLTAQFPSTTAAQVTTINTGLPVGQSGVYEWFYYEPQVDDIIAPLLFSFARDAERDTLKSTNINAADLFPTDTIYQQLHQHGVTSHLFPYADFAQSPYNKIVTNGAEHIHPFKTLEEGLTTLTNAILTEKNQSYFYFYFGTIDSVAHHYGPDSPEFEKEIDQYFTKIEKIFFEKVINQDTLILLTADHGQVTMYPETTMYLNKEIPDIADYFITTQSGKPIVPAGSARDMFLHVKKDRIKYVKKILDSYLNEKAEVYEVDDLIHKGFFGTKQPSHDFLSRVGNLVILPYKNEAVWWYEEGVFEQNLKGHHGGLTKEEMEIPFLALSL